MIETEIAEVSGRPAPDRAENRPLTAMRGLAAMWVIGSHITLSFQEHWSGWSWDVLRAGYMGVDIFFVLSGFIMAVVYARLTAAQAPFFLFKRALRVYPLNIVTLLIYWGLTETVFSMGTWADVKLLPYFLLMVQVYLPSIAAAWNPATWSVGVELLCYLAFPAAVMAMRQLPTPWLGTLAGFGLAALYWAQGRFLGSWWSWPAVARGMFDFWPGVALGLLALRLPRLPAAWASVAEILGVAGIAAAVAFGGLRLVPVFAAALIMALFFDAGVVSRALRARPLVWIGRISFSIYLMHAVILAHMLPLATTLSWHMPWSVAIPLFLTGFFMIVLALSHLTYIVVEQPGRRLARFWPRPAAQAPSAAAFESPQTATPR